MSIETNDLDKFIFRTDNREKINDAHVKVLVNSIRSCNLLSMKPILVNEQMEIIDGQHRVLAAKELGVSIFYDVRQDITPRHMILLNNTKSWTLTDHLHFYLQHEYVEYKKLADFMRFNEITLKVSLSLLIGGTHAAYQRFKDGEFVMNTDVEPKHLRICRDTQDTLSRLNGHSYYMFSMKFYKAHLIMTRNENFNQEKWESNLKRMSERVCPKVSYKDFLKLFVDIHNWRNPIKIFITDDDIKAKDDQKE